MADDPGTSSAATSAPAVEDTAPPRRANRPPRPMDEVIQAGMTPTLLSLGFKRTKRRTYVLETPTLVTFVEFVPGKYGDTEFFEDTGIFVRPLQTLMEELAGRPGMSTACAGTNMPGHISQSARVEEILRRRALWQQKHPPWGLRRLLGWQRRPPPYVDEIPFAGWRGWEPYGKPVEQMGHYIRDLWLTHTKPWLDRCNDLNFVASELLTEWRAGHNMDIFYPALRCLAGNTTGIEPYLERAIARGRARYEEARAPTQKARRKSRARAAFFDEKDPEAYLFSPRIALALARKFSVPLSSDALKPFV